METLSMMKPLHYGVWFSSPFGKLLTVPKHSEWCQIAGTLVSFVLFLVKKVCLHLVKDKFWSVLSIATLCSKDRVSGWLVFMSNWSFMAALASPTSCGSSSSLLILCSSPSACLASLIFLMLAWACNIFCNLEW